MSSVKIHPCLVCGNMTRNRFTCSKECSSIRLFKRLVECLKCGQTIPKNYENKKFCNRSCATSFNNKGIVRNPNGIGGFSSDTRSFYNKGGGLKATVKNCKGCNSPIKYKRIYCSNQCQKTYQYQARVAEWKENPNVVNNKYGQIPPFLRRFLLEEANYQCTLATCSSVDFEGVILEIDHVDGDAHNNSPENLRVVCPQCHALSPFHRALNKKSSRINRVKKLVHL